MNIDKDLLEKMFPNSSSKKNTSLKLQKYEDLVDFIHDYHSDRVNWKLPISIMGLNLEHIQKRNCYITLIFNPTKEQEPIIEKMKDLSEHQGGHWFGVRIFTFEIVKQILNGFDKNKWEKLPISIPVIKLSELEKKEIETLLGKEGGPHSTIEFLIKNINEDNKNLIVSQIYHILEVRMTSVNSIHELLYYKNIRIDYELVNNKEHYDDEKSN